MKTTLVNILTTAQAISGCLFLTASCYSLAPDWTIWIPFTVLSLAFACSVAVQYSEIPVDK